MWNLYIYGWDVEGGGSEIPTQRFLVKAQLIMIVNTRRSPLRFQAQSLIIFAMSHSAAASTRG